MAVKKGGLGESGINAFFDNSAEHTDALLDGENVTQVDISLIDRNSKQPRKNFKEESIDELASSIKQNGVIQPLVLSKTEDGRYIIVAGERRFRASIKAGLKTVPAMVRSYTDAQIQEISLIENLQREDLNAIEVAEGIRELMDTHGFTQEEIASKIGKSRPYVTNTLRLLQLPNEVKDMVAAGELSPGHARALISIDDKAYLINLARQCIEKNMSVRELEKNVRLYFTRKNITSGPRQSQELTIEMKEFVADMRRIFSTRVKIKGTEKKGRIFIDYFSEDDLNRIYSLIYILKNSKY